MMMIKKLQNEISYDLKKAGIPNYLFEAKTILCNILNINQLDLIFKSEEIIKDEKVQLILEIIEKRRKGWPLQYLLGSQEFMSLTFKVNNDVLIPRQDTECLVEHIISLAIESKRYNILDIGTGSGCIAVSLGYYIKESIITAIDMSANALEVAKENAKKNSVENKIEFLRKNIFEYEPQENNYDFIVSNPPYIPTNVIKGLSQEVRDYEPYNALDGGRDGLNFYPRIIDIAYSSLKSGGYLSIEVGHDQAKKVVEIIQNNKGFEEVEIIMDLCGIERVVSAKKIIRD